MGRITDLLPALYHGGDNDITRFTDILDFEVKELERYTRGITDLINIDKCPNDKLPYLAAFINCPLIGDDPVFWRKQIRNWPYILRLKGTQRSLELVLDSIDIEDSKIKTFFRDERGKYVTDKPDGEPFIDRNGLWRNIRTHYFGIDLTLSKYFVEARNFDWEDSEIKEKLQFWFERGKPYHSELLHMMIFPPNLLPDDHFCRWDFCDWEHILIQRYNWGMMIPSNPIFTAEPSFASTFERGFYTVSDLPMWGFSTWDGTPYRMLHFGQQLETGFYASLDYDNPTWLIPYNWGKVPWSEAGKVRADFFIDFERGFFTPSELNSLKISPIASEFFRGIICDLQPYWDTYTWTEHNTWCEEVEQQPFALASETPIDVSLDWGDDSPIPTWSSHKTWAGSDTWCKSAELAATGQIAIFDLQEAS